MDEFNKIRKAYFIDKQSINEIATNFKRSWATVHKIVTTSRDEFSYEKEVKRNPKVATQEVVKAIADLIQEEDQLKVKRKQRLTSKKIYEELVERGIYKGSSRQMRHLVKEVREKFAKKQPKSFLPLDFTLGSAAQIDHGEVECSIEGVRKTYYLFVLSVPGAVLRYCQIFATKAQEAWGEFLERGFHFYNGIFPRVISDNDTVLIKEIKGDTHLMTDFALHLSEHYGFECNFCNPAAGNEKGSVENAIGYCRRNYLNGCPTFKDVQQANEYLRNKCQETIENNMHYRNEQPLAEIKSELKKKLLPLLPPKTWRRWFKRRVNSYQQVEVESHCYSVPEKFVLANIRVGVGAEWIDVFDGDNLVVRHKRQYNPGDDSLFLDHYLEQLSRKPGALWDCKAVKEINGDEILTALWEKLYSRFPNLKDEQAKLRHAQIDFIEVLMLRKRYQEIEWKEGIRKALVHGATSAASIECIIRGVLAPNLLGDSCTDLQNKIEHLNVPKLQFNLSSYATLVSAEASC